MRFKGFTWPVNPTALRVECQRNLKETMLPFAGSSPVDLGEKKRRVTGEGWFAGKDCDSQWQRLEALFQDGVKLLGREGPALLKYGFSFTEHHGGLRWRGQGVHHAAAGESLWDYAGRYGWDVEELRRANLHIRDIACLEQGEEVFAP